MTHWFRLADASATLRGVFPSGLAPIYHAVTLLGSPTLLLIVLAVAFWAINRRDAQFLLSLAFFAMGLVIVTKTWFALPRPPTDVALVAPSDSYGFPSGHAIAATVVYGGAVLTVDRFRTRWGALVAGVIVAAVCLSRVALGVHYLGDVITGIALGLLIVVAVTQLTHENAVPTFAGAVVVAVIAFLQTGATDHVVLDLGGSLGGLLAVTTMGEQNLPHSMVERIALAVVGLVFLGGSHEIADALPSPVLSAAANIVLVCGILALPSVATLVQSRRQSSVKS